MSYSSKRNRPLEWASKSQHTHIINDPEVSRILSGCKFPSTQNDVFEDIDHLCFSIREGVSGDIKQIVSIDGGYTETEVRKPFPSSRIAFFQFGALLFKFADLLSLSEKPFIHPDDMEKFNKLERYKLALPSKGISYNDMDLNCSIREILFDFFNAKNSSTTFMETLCWFLFHEYKDNPKKEITLGSSPFEPIAQKIKIKRDWIKEDGSFIYQDNRYYLTDFFRFHEVIDNELGAGGILGYLTNVIEHVILIHCVKELYKSKPSHISRFLFIKDGPLGFFGQTAGLHSDMRELCNFFIPRYGLKILGIEKSGTFVEHAEEISRGDNSPLKINTALLLSNSYIYKHILPASGNEDSINKLPVYAHTSYYSGKIIYRSLSDRVFVVTIPIDDFEKIREPRLEYFQNIHEILGVVDRLKCDMYDNAVIPIALVNKLVSLANHPSSRVLEKFANSYMD
ncbi:DNA double-strand break repair nuclease NurA [Trabulsiella odontotermitis]|uniref:NurA domain-containing protein n=1 Tax=Trabulsiella odontotermitis TaxID=379893 RepID=A0A0L0H387_9ENTR|nr:DNA double-strand break repair nuclease NurA [Trabulsiella odontotermitis]KNC95647.1 hypothetical protein GM31_23160 [Trabulsiella odontotermitis]